MARKVVYEIEPHKTLCIDDKTGIAWVEDGTTGMSYSCHASIDKTGSIRGMKNMGYWGKKDRTAQAHGFIFNIDTLWINSEYDKIAADNCQCAACVERRKGIYVNPNL